MTTWTQPELTRADFKMEKDYMEYLAGLAINGVTANIIRLRIRRGYSLEKALTTKTSKGRVPSMDHPYKRSSYQAGRLALQKKKSDAETAAYQEDRRREDSLNQIKAKK
jgi:hypothetical protein